MFYLYSNENQVLEYNGREIKTALDGVFMIVLYLEDESGRVVIIMYFIDKLMNII